MELATSNPLKPSSNISEIVSKFANVCKLRSIGVFLSENPVQHQDQCHNYKDSNGGLFEGSSGSTEIDGVKIHPQPVEVPSKSNVCGDVEVEMLFDIVSALKSAYVQLQEAHIPYDTKKIEVADELVVAELEALYKIKRVYKEKQFTKPVSDSSCFALRRAELGVNERLLAELKSQVKVKNSEIMRLQQELQELEMGNAKMVAKFKQMSLERKNATALNITTFQKAFREASKSVHDFAKPLIGLMKASGWDLDQAVKSIEPEAVYSKRSDKKYAFEAYIARRMFGEISLEKNNVDDVMRFDDPVDALIENRDSDFAKFCGKKYLLVVHPMMEESFFGNLDHRMFVSSGKHPRTPFYQIFARMAKWVWVLQGIAASLDPMAKAFAVNRGTEFSGVCMESVEDEKEGAVLLNEEQLSRRVEFMIMPGFKVGETLVRSRVYISKTEASLD